MSRQELQLQLGLKDPLRDAVGVVPCVIDVQLDGASTRDQLVGVVPNLPMGQALSCSPAMIRTGVRTASR